MSLATPDKIRMLQRKLYHKAKEEPDYRFYLLYDKIYRADILVHAYDLARANQGAPGVDGQTFAEIETLGLEEWLDGIGKELRTKTYQPQPVRRVMIPKPGGGERPLGIPTIRDRVVQTAAKLVLEPIFEADLEPSAYGYRPSRSGIDAVKAVHRLLCQGLHRCGGRRFVEVFRHDSARRLCCVGRGADRRSACPASDQDVAQGTGRGDGCGWKTAHERRQAKHLRHAAGRGDQPAARQSLHEPLPPKHWREPGRGEAFRAHVVNYADDFVILSRGNAEEALAWTRRVMTEARSHGERSEDHRARCAAGALRLPGLQLRTAPLPQGWPLVSGGKPVAEERAAPQGSAWERSWSPPTSRPGRRCATG